MAKLKEKRKQELPKLSNTLIYTDFDEDHPAPKGKWNSDVFKNNKPIVLELACGKGEYSLGLAQLEPHKNYVGIDIKGNRLWLGATGALEQQLENVRYLRAYIDHLDQFFGEDEVSEIWIVFSDPYIKKERKRLTAPKFIELYQKILKPNGVIHLKTDSDILYSYTKEVIEQEGLELLIDEPDVHANRPDDPKLSIITYYENKHLANKKTIKYLQFRLG